MTPFECRCRGFANWFNSSKLLFTEPKLDSNDEISELILETLVFKIVMLELNELSSSIILFDTVVIELEILDIVELIILISLKKSV